MGWLRSLLASEADEDWAVEDLEADMTRLCEQVRLQSRIDDDQDSERALLRAEIGELKLYLAVVIRLLVAKGVVTKEDLARLVDVIDRSDGSADGQFSGDIAQHRTWTGEGDEPQQQ